MELEYFETGNGIKYAALESLDDLAETGLAALDEYDYTVAKTHLYNYGAIFIGEFQDVLDNEYELEEVAAHYATIRGDR